MLDIKFSGKTDKPELNNGLREYRAIWEKEGEKIVKTLESMSGLKFKEDTITATISETSFSHPLTLKASISKERKLATLIHELIHILFNDIKLPKIEDSSLEVHKLIYLFQYDVLIVLYGEDFAIRNAKADIKYRPKIYKLAWDWALSFSKEERAKKFKEITSKYQKT